MTDFPGGTLTDWSAAKEAAVRGGSVAERTYAINLQMGSHLLGMEMVVVPPGEFLMGAPEREVAASPREFPQHPVRIAHPFALGKYPVTVEAFSAFVDDTGYHTGDSAFVLEAGAWKFISNRNWCRPGFEQSAKHPVTCVNWGDAHAFVKWMNDKLHLSERADKVRLPSEAEWECACRAGTSSAFAFGEIISPDQANYDGNETYGEGSKGIFRGGTTAVGLFPQNRFGLCDMHGNVWEWCEDAWNPSFDNSPTDGSSWLTGDQSRRVFRGGSWVNPPSRLRSASRSKYDSHDRSFNLGFRIAQTLQAGSK